MKEQLFNFIEQKCPGAKPLLIVIRGSKAYGTSLPTSDIDYAGVYIQSQDDILGNNYKEQINDDKNDTVFYEIKRFLELVASNNPTILELLNTPDDCIIYKNPIFDDVLSIKDKFITKTCLKSFGGYAIQQIKKAKGGDKKQNWEKEKVTRKGVLDFVYVIENGKSINWKKWNETRGYDENYIGSTNIPNARDLYSLYYDNHKIGMYKGLVKVGGVDNYGESNQLRLSSIPKEETPIAIISYNKEGYTQHCIDFKSYEEWIKNRNESRWVDVKTHGQKIDGKNMMHCRRLLEMAKEIGEGKGIIVRRENREELLKIRKGEIDLQSLIDKAEQDIKDLNDIFDKSNLPEKVENSLINKILIEIRKKHYELKY